MDAKNFDEDMKSVESNTCKHANLLLVRLDEHEVEVERIGNGLEDTLLWGISAVVWVEAREPTLPMVYVPTTKSVRWLRLYAMMKGPSEGRKKERKKEKI
jgi:hypothetical protein